MCFEGYVLDVYSQPSQLVRSGNNVADVDVVPTFASGTLLVTHRQQRGREALPLFAEPSNPGVSDSSPAAESEAEASAGASPASPPLNQSMARKVGAARTAETVYPVPIAVLSLHEHAYLGEKYGVWGRKQYARDWWKSLDWRRVK
jgi:Fe-Mn family superoxide dismutase